MDINGDVLVTEQFSNIITIEGTTLTSSRDKDILLVRISTSGTANWVNQFIGIGNDNPTAINTDTPGNIYLAGNYASNNFPIGSATQTIGTGASNMFYCKFDSVWLK